MTNLYGTLLKSYSGLSEKKKKKKGFNIHFSGLLFVKKQKKGHKPNFFSFAGHL